MRSRLAFGQFAGRVGAAVVTVVVRGGGICSSSRIRRPRRGAREQRRRGGRRLALEIRDGGMVVVMMVWGGRVEGEDICSCVLGHDALSVVEGQAGGERGEGKVLDVCRGAILASGLVGVVCLIHFPEGLWAELARLLVILCI
jgi:hypothetical protein